MFYNFAVKNHGDMKIALAMTMKRCLHGCMVCLVMGIALIMAVLICGFIVFYRNVNPVLQNSEKEGTPVLTENLSPEALSSYLLDMNSLHLLPLYFPGVYVYFR